MKLVSVPFDSSWLNWYLTMSLKVSTCSNTFVSCGLRKRRTLSSCLLTFLNITQMLHLALKNPYVAFLPGRQVNFGCISWRKCFGEELDEVETRARMFGQDIPLDTFLLRCGCIAKCWRNLSSYKQVLPFHALFLMLHGVIGHVLTLIASTTRGGHNCQVLM